MNVTRQANWTLDRFGSGLREKARFGGFGSSDPPLIPFATAASAVYHENNVNVLELRCKLPEARPSLPIPSVQGIDLPGYVLARGAGERAPPCRRDRPDDSPSLSSLDAA